LVGTQFAPLPSNWAVVSLELAADASMDMLGNHVLFPGAGMAMEATRIITFSSILSGSNRAGIGRFLANLAAITSSSCAPLVVFDGDSKTEGTGGRTASNCQFCNYPLKTAVLMHAANKPMDWIMVGLGSECLGFPGGPNSTTMLSKFNNDVLPLISDPNRPIKVVSLEAGLNDIYYGRVLGGWTQTQSIDNIISYLTTYSGLVRAQGAKLLYRTLMPAEPTFTSYGFDMEANRLALNTAIRANASLFDYLDDLGADSTMGVQANALDQDSGTAGYQNTYWEDGVHPTSAGNDILASRTYTGLVALGL